MIASLFRTDGRRYLSPANPKDLITTSHFVQSEMSDNKSVIVNWKSETKQVADATRLVCLHIQDAAFKLDPENRYGSAIDAVEHDFVDKKIWIDIQDATLAFFYNEDSKDGQLHVKETECDITRDPWLPRVATALYLAAFARLLKKPSIEIQSPEIRALHFPACRDPDNDTSAVKIWSHRLSIEWYSTIFNHPANF